MASPNSRPSALTHTPIQVPEDALLEVLRYLPLDSVLELRLVNSLFHSHYSRLREGLVEKLVAKHILCVKRDHQLPSLCEQPEVAYWIYYWVGDEWWRLALKAR